MVVNFCNDIKTFSYMYSVHNYSLLKGEHANSCKNRHEMEIRAHNNLKFCAQIKHMHMHIVMHDCS